MINIVNIFHASLIYLLFLNLIVIQFRIEWL